MYVIGITGGVGAGKSQMLKYIKGNYNCRVVLADEVAHFVKEPGQICYQELVELLGSDILNPDGTIHNKRMANLIFSNDNLLERVNNLIHPAVKKYIIEEINFERQRNQIKYFFIEAALLIEDQYYNICDELWYVYADRETRKQRLMVSRGYTEEKIASIMDSQADEEIFRRFCRTVIDNSGLPEASYKQIDTRLEEL